jgi:phosphatidylglycerol:prolipoprotein diacylglycerol transferase
VAHLTWDVSPVLLSAGPVSIRWYGALFALGFYIGLQVMNGIARREKLQPREFDSILLYVILGTVIGARLGHVFLYEPEVFLQEPVRILKVWEGGLASHGGTVGVILAVLLWKRRYYPGSFLSLLDRLAVPSAWVAGMIRLGNLFNSEILGRPSDVPWAMVFRRVDELPRHPAMLYEAFCYFALFALLMGMIRRGSYRDKGDGYLLGVFFTGLFGARFMIEFVKELQVSSEAALPLDLGQLLSVPFIAAGVFLMVRALRRAKTAPKR